MGWAALVMVDWIHLLVEGTSRMGRHEGKVALDPEKLAYKVNVVSMATMPPKVLVDSDR